MDHINPATPQSCALQALSGGQDDGHEHTLRQWCMASLLRSSLCRLEAFRMCALATMQPVMMKAQVRPWGGGGGMV